METEVAFYGPLRDSVGEKSVVVTLPDGSTVKDAIDGIIAEYPETEERLYGETNSVGDQVIIAKNNQSIEQLDGLQTRLNAGDTLRFSPPVTGGMSGGR